MKVHAYAAHRAGAPPEPYEYDAGPLGALEVDVRVTHCGVCYSDIGRIDDEFGGSTFPLVAGHEAVGIVEAIGEEVDSERMPIGGRVGVGAISGSCFRCAWCVSGQQQHCPQRDDTLLRGDRGGFAHHVRASDWRHAHPIPDAIPSEQAAPLLCAGATVFSPMVRRGVRPTDRVAVVGIGGLGHLAVQFFAAWGCDVTAISSTRAKEGDARRFGANQVIGSAEPGALAAARNTFDFVLSTVSADLPWDEYLSILRPGGMLCVVGLPEHPMTFSALSLLPEEKVIAGGIPGSAVDTARMLEFAARHGVRPQVENYPVADIGIALERVREGRARYRAVLAM